MVIIELCRKIHLSKQKKLGKRLKVKCDTVSSPLFGVLATFFSAALRYFPDSVH